MLDYVLTHQPRSRQPLITRRFWLIISISLVLSFSSSLHADDDQYQEMVAEGIAEFQRGNYAEASVLFKKAHKLRPNARTLRGMGMCAFEMREYVSALDLLERALQEKRRPLTDELRHVVKSLITRSKEFIAKYEVKLVPEDATLLINGVPVDLKSGQLRLDPGHHKLIVEADGYRSISLDLRVKGGEQRALELKLVLATSEDDNSESGFDKSTAPPVADTSDASSSEPLWTWVAAGSAAAFAAVGGLFWILGQDAYDDIEQACKPYKCPTREQVDRVVEDTNLYTYETLTTVSLVLSGAAIAGAVALFFVETSSRPETPGVAVDIGNAGVQLTGRF